jgi:hypothetical protein
MGERDSKDKEQVEKIRVPVIFRTETADDGFLKLIFRASSTSIRKMVLWSRNNMLTWPMAAIIWLPV